MNLRHKKKIEHTNLGLMLWHGVRSYGGVIGKTKKNGLKTGVRSYGGVIEIRRIYQEIRKDCSIRHNPLYLLMISERESSVSEVTIM